MKKAKRLRAATWGRPKPWKPVNPSPQLPSGSALGAQASNRVKDALIAPSFRRASAPASDRLLAHFDMRPQGPAFFVLELKAVSACLFG